jgi:hypothetical protein
VKQLVFFSLSKKSGRNSVLLQKRVEPAALPAGPCWTGFRKRFFSNGFGNSFLGTLLCIAPQRDVPFVGKASEAGFSTVSKKRAEAARFFVWNLLIFQVICSSGKVDSPICISLTH